MRCLDYMKVTEILRLSEMGYFTLREIAASVGCSKTTVGEILSRCKECGLTYADASCMTADRINELIYPESFGRKPVKDEPDWEAIHKELQKNPRRNLNISGKKITDLLILMDTVTADFVPSTKGGRIALANRSYFPRNVSPVKSSLSIGSATNFLAL